MTAPDLPSRIEFAAVDAESTPQEFARIFQEYWPAYAKWMRRASPETPGHRVAQFRKHMPELVPVFEELLELFGGGDEIASFLTLHNPPRVVRGCSQIVLDDDGPVLLRSYDHHPNLIDELLLRSTWLGRATLAMTDCLWGALDGLNESGLAVALAFGGRDAIGPGFAAPLVTRYLLETCSTVGGAKEALARVPVYMPYTFVVADQSGDFVTAYTGPDMPTRFVTRRASTNHQSANDWPEYRRQTQSVERLGELESLLNRPSTVGGALESFLRAPLWRTDYAHASGTLYVAEYRPRDRTLALHWPGQTERFSLDSFQPRLFPVELDTRRAEV